MQRTLLLTLSAIAIAVLVIVGGILLWRTTTRPGGILGGPAVSPSPGAQALPWRTVSVGTAVSPSRDPEGIRVRYFDANEGKLKEAEFRAELVRTVSEAVPKTVFRLHWSPVSNDAIIEYLDEFDSRRLSLVNAETGSSTPLHPNIRSLAWSPDGIQIAYQFRDDVTGENSIFISKPDTSSRRMILAIQILNANLFWVSPDVLVIAEAPTPGIPSLVLRYDLKRNQTSVVFADKYGASVLPAPDGTKLLVSATRDAAGTALITEIIDDAGQPIAVLPFGTMAEKCAWGTDSATIFCAVPQFAGAEGLPFSYWTGSVSSNDEFMSYRLTTAEKKSLSGGALDADAVDLVIPNTEDSIAFVNRKTGTLSIWKP